MSYDKEVIIRARRRYEDRLQEHRREYAQRREEVYRRFPRVAELDGLLRQTSAQVMLETFKKGRDPSAAVERIHEENRALQEERAAILSRAGLGADYLDDGPLCRICGDRAYLGEKMCSCFEKLCREEQKKDLTGLLSGDRKSFDDFSLDYYSEAMDPALGNSPRLQMQMVYDVCVGYATKFSLNSRNLLMNGGTGLGKTFLSGCIASQVVSMGYSVYYDTAVEIFSCLEKEKFGGGDAENQRRAEKIMGCDLLILDDLGTEMLSAFISTALYSIINGRLMSGRPTIISTNLTVGRLAERYTPQIASRLMGEYVNLVFAGQDIRLLKNR